MSRGRSALERALDELLTAGYCNDYHCAGDCGTPHNEAERIDMVRGTKLDFGAIRFEQRPCDFQQSNTALGGWHCNRCGTGTNVDSEGNVCTGYFQEVEIKRRGRPPKPPGTHTTTPRRTIRLDAERWAKLKQLGADWLRKQIDSA